MNILTYVNAVFPWCMVNNAYCVEGFTAENAEFAKELQKVSCKRGYKSIKKQEGLEAANLQSFLDYSQHQRKI